MNTRTFLCAMCLLMLIARGSISSAATVIVQPSSVNTHKGNTVFFDATVTDAVNTSVDWAVNAIPGGNRTTGYISRNGLYEAPFEPEVISNAMIRATSVEDPTAYDDASAFIIPEPQQTVLGSGKYQAIIYGENAGDNLGGYGIDIFDVNDDGIDDICICAIVADTENGIDSGAVYIIYGRMGGFSGVTDLKNPGTTEMTRIIGATANQKLGRAITCGDINSDGFDDVLISAWVSNPGIVIIWGGTTLPETIDLSTPSSYFTKINYPDGGPWSLDAGDINGDGIDDIVTGHRHAGIGGKVLIVAGRSSWPSSISTTELSNVTEILAEREGDQLSRAISCGNFNGDTYDDVIFGAPGETSGGGDRPGAAYILFGEPVLPPVIDLLDPPNNVTFIVAEGSRDGLGKGSSAGDFNNDGYEDAVIASIAADGSYWDDGRVYILYGTPSFPQTINLSTYSNKTTIYGSQACEYISAETNGMGDLDTDGNEDLLVMGYAFDYSGKTNVGALYCVYGKPNMPASINFATTTAGYRKIIGIDAFDQVGDGACGDIDGDGQEELVLTALNGDPAGRTDAGEAYIIDAFERAPSAHNCNKFPAMTSRTETYRSTGVTLECYTETTTTVCASKFREMPLFCPESMRGFWEIEPVYPAANTNIIFHYYEHELDYGGVDEEDVWLFCSDDGLLWWEAYAQDKDTARNIITFNSMIDAGKKVIQDYSNSDIEPTDEIILPNYRFFTLTTRLDPANTPPTLSVITPSTPQSGDIVIPYILYDTESDPALVKVSYSINNGVTFVPATQSFPSEPTYWLSTSPAGENHTFTWASDIDLPEQQYTGVIVLIVVYQAKILSGNSDVTDPFDIANPYLVYSEDFTEGSGGWFPSGKVADFTLPIFGYDGHSLQIRAANDNYYTFGYWSSPMDIISDDGNSVFKFTWTFESDVEYPITCPEIRLRVNTNTFEYGGGMGIKSMSDCLMPCESRTARYHFYFRPVVSELYDFPPYSNLLLAYDMLNFEPADSKTGMISLDKISVDKIPLSEFPAFTNYQTYDFESSVQGWYSGHAKPLFSEPYTSYIGGSLSLASVDHNCFGYWSSPLISTEPDTLYRASFFVGSSELYPYLTPTVRLRVNTEGGDLYWFVAAESVGMASSSPAPVPVNYELYFDVPGTLFEQGKSDVYCSFDLINMDWMNNPNGVLYLENVDLDKAE